MKKKQSFAAAGTDKGLRAPYKLLFFMAFLVPALNNLIFGWGAMLCSWFALQNEAFRTVGTVLGVALQIVRVGSLACTFLTLGFYAGKEGFKKALLPICAALLFAFLASGAGLGAFALMIAWGMTDSVASFSAQFLSGLEMALWDLLILAVVELIVTFFFRLICSHRRDEPFLTPRSPFMVTAYIVFACYMLIDLAFALKGVSGGFIDYFIPVLYRVIYACVMAVTALLFRRRLAAYFGAEEELT